MSDRLKKQIELELELLQRLLEVHKPILEKAARQITPTPIEISALGAMLHSFYSGIENILKRIVTEIDNRHFCGESWHRELLQLAANQTPNRPAVFTEDLCSRLEEYLRFRHRFRHSYSFQLNWEHMSSLVLSCEDIFRQVTDELQKFILQL